MYLYLQFAVTLKRLAFFKLLIFGMGGKGVTAINTTISHHLHSLPSLYNMLDMNSVSTFALVSLSLSRL